MAFNWSTLEKFTHKSKARFCFTPVPKPRTVLTLSYWSTTNSQERTLLLSNNYEEATEFLVGDDMSTKNDSTDTLETAKTSVPDLRSRDRDSRHSTSRTRHSLPSRSNSVWFLFTKAWFVQ